MKTLLLIVIFLAFSEVVNAESWDTTDKVLGATSVALQIVDWGQTRYIAKHPELYRENNVLLGEHPSVSRVDAYYGATILGTLFLADWLTPANRKLWLGTVTAVELVVVNHNRRIDVKIAF